MPIRISFVALCVALWAMPASAQDNTVTLAVPESVANAGLWTYVLPRFTLKTRVRVTLDPSGALALDEAADGPAALVAGDTVLRLSEPGSEAATRFADWLTSDVGRNTIDSYAEAAGEPAFAAPDAAAIQRKAVAYEGDAVAGEDLSLTHCGRCHVVNDRNRMNGLGSTPSFGMLRSMADWARRFEGFFALNPHGAFTQITDVTAPFPIDRPSPIAPVEITLDELDAILAFVQQMPPADLGAPIRHQ
ncbi:c-type cytochrome [Meridianimarinicoccus aquatilis]|uniref:c-type cytochrome n=1 Tax=Meridianimarinicoccus aquatilis TaxID=2552766 RepID=UPI001FB69188|nr:cytochrome c [Fluviibacterium aquatile]